MSATKEELHRLLESLPEKDLTEVGDFVKVLLKEPEELTEEERQDVREGEAEVRLGEWVTWQDVRREDV